MATKHLPDANGNARCDSLDLLLRRRVTYNNDADCTACLKGREADRDYQRAVERGRVADRAKHLAEAAHEGRRADRIGVMFDG